MLADEKLVALEVRVRGMEDWKVEHDARINEYWIKQWDTNKAMKVFSDDLDTRASVLERKFYVMAGVSSAVGSMSGVALMLILAYLKP